MALPCPDKNERDWQPDGKQIMNPSSAPVIVTVMMETVIFMMSVTGIAGIRVSVSVVAPVIVTHYDGSTTRSSVILLENKYVPGLTLTGDGERQ